MTARARTNLIVGVAAGLLAVALLMFPAQTPTVGTSALLAPVLAGIVAVVLNARREKRELDVDEAIAIGGSSGFSGGFVVAVPLPLAMIFFAGGGLGQAGPRWMAATGLAATLMIAAVLLIVFVTLAVVSAVITARIVRPRRSR